MDSRRQALEVCMCGAAQEQITLLLHTLAGGHLLGKTQHLHLTLQDSAKRVNELEEQALDLHDACYPLLTEVRTETSLQHSLSRSDVVLLMLEASELEDMVTVVAQYAAALNQIPRTRQRAVILVGHRALTAAGVLCVLASQLSQHLVLAVELPNTSNRCSQTSSSYQLADRVSEHVQAWWNEIQEMGAQMVEMSSHCLPSMPTSCFLPMSMGMMGQDTAAIDIAASSDWQHKTQAVEEVKTAIKHLQLSETDLITSTVSCKL